MWYSSHPSHIPTSLPQKMHQQAMAAQEKDGQNRLKKLQKVNRFHVNGVSVSCMFPQLPIAFWRVDDNLQVIKDAFSCFDKQQPPQLDLQAFAFQRFWEVIVIWRSVECSKMPKEMVNRTRWGPSLEISHWLSLEKHTFFHCQKSTGRSGDAIFRAVSKWVKAWGWEDVIRFACEKRGLFSFEVWSERDHHPELLEEIHRVILSLKGRRFVTSDDSSLFCGCDFWYPLLGVQERWHGVLWSFWEAHAEARHYHGCWSCSFLFDHGQ